MIVERVVTRGDAVEAYPGHTSLSKFTSTPIAAGGSRGRAGALLEAFCDLPRQLVMHGAHEEGRTVLGEGPPHLHQAVFDCNRLDHYSSPKASNGDIGLLSGFRRRQTPRCLSTPELIRETQAASIDIGCRHTCERRRDVELRTVSHPKGCAVSQPDAGCIVTDPVAGWSLLVTPTFGWGAL